MRKTLLFLVLYLMGLSCWSQSKPYGPIPSEKQLHWQEMEMYAFILGTRLQTSRHEGYHFHG